MKDLLAPLLDCPYTLPAFDDALFTLGPFPRLDGGFEKVRVLLVEVTELVLMEAVEADRFH